MKRLLTTLLCIIMACGSTLYAQEIRQFINCYMEFGLYENNHYSKYILSDIHTIDSLEYKKESNGRYCYRQDGNKVYCYTVAENKESLVMDFGLEVGDTFALYDGLNVTVELISDTVMHKSSCKVLYLRGIEQPRFTDVWIEDIGSLRYGINPPQTGETHLISVEDDEMIYRFNFLTDSACGMYVRYGKVVDEWEWDWNEYEAAQANRRLTFDLRNDTLYIGGYIADYCIGSTYFLFIENVGEIHIGEIKPPGFAEADCISVYAIDVKVPGFTQERYTVRFGSITAAVTQKGTSMDLIIEEESVKSPYYDLMGRKVTHPTRGIYIKDGRKVVIE